MKLSLLFIALTLNAQYEALDRTIRTEAQTHQIPALSLAISTEQKTIHTFHAGTANKQTLYRAGSLTTLFTAIAILQLVETGKLDLDAPISRYLPELSYKSTLRQILAHRGGIVREPGKGHYFDTTPTTLRQVTQSLKNTPLIYPPGTVTKYSNAGFALLGDVIERTTNQPYATYIRDQIFKPLVLNSSYLKLADIPPGRLPASLMWTLDGRQFPAPNFDLGTISASNLITNTEDILRVARWWMSDNPAPILSRKSLDSIWLPQSGGTVYGHSALLQIDPKRKWAAVAFAAKDSVDFVLRPLIQLAANPTSTYQPALPPTIETLSQFTAEPKPFSSKALAEYGWDYSKLYLLEHNGQLHCLIEWFSLVALEKLAPNRYRFPDKSLYAGEILTIQPNGLTVGPVWFPRLPAPNRNFRIVMQKPLAELQQIAASTQPPIQPEGLRTPDLVNLKTLSPTIHFDIRYATANNFMGTPLYSQPAAYLQKPAATALLAAHNHLAKQGFGLLIHDAYRPWRVTKMFWEATPDAQRNFVADPSKGSRHNRGCAVDLSLYDLKTGKPVQMPSGFDEFSDRAFPNYPGGTSHERWLRSLLRSAMEQQGFTVNDDEWWHYDFRDWKLYPVTNTSFEQLGSR